MLRSRLFAIIALIFILSGIAATVSAQQAVINRFVEHVSKKVADANRLMESNQVEEAIETLTDANRYIDSAVRSDFEDQLFRARKENGGFSFDLQLSLARGFSADYWRQRHEQANTSLRLAREAISGLSSIRLLDRQDEAFAYMKTVYDSVVTIKDVVSSVKSQSYFEAIKNAKEGVDGFVENYKAIEEAKFKKIETDSLEMQMNGLVRRANRIINAVEPVLSYMKANAEEADRFNGLLEKVAAIRQKVLSGAVQKMEFNDARYTWNSEPLIREINKLCAEIKAGSLLRSDADSSFKQLTEQARAGWQEVRKNIADSDDEEQKPKMTQWADQEWQDFAATSQKLFNEALAAAKLVEKKGSDKKSAGVNLFAGGAETGKKPDLFAGSTGGSKKPDLFAGANDGRGDSEGDADERPPLDEKKPNLFAGHADGSAKTANDDSTQQQKISVPEQPDQTDQPDKKAPKTHAKTESAKKLGEIYTTGTGDTSTQVGGNYYTAPLVDLADDDIIEVDVSSGQLKFVHIHLRNSRGVWLSVYNGTNKLFRVGNLIQRAERDSFTHLIFSVNSQHTKNLPIACKANLLLHKGENIPEKIQAAFSAQWRAGSGEIPNDYLKQRPALVYAGKSSVASAGSKSAGSVSSGQKTGSSQSAAGAGTTGTAAAKSKTDKLVDDKLALANKVNAIIRRANEEFNKKYWNEKAPQKTTQKPTNSKASTLKIMREALPIAAGANLPENRIFLNNLIADKLIEYSGRVFDYVGKAEFHSEAAALIKRTGDLIAKVNNSDKVTISFLYSDLGDRWRALGKTALVGNHAYNKNDCYRLEQAAYERALSIYPENFRAKKALNR